MLKKYLLTPGPTPVPAEVLSAEGMPILHHRTSEFSELFKNVSKSLKSVFQTDQDALIISSSGTGAMESAVTNLLSPGDNVLVLETGVFGARWAQIIKKFEIEPFVIKEEYGDAVCLKTVAEVLEKEKNIKAIFATFTETSTGVCNDIKGLAELVKDKETVLVVDAISGLGGQEFRTDAWGVDFVVAGSQKGLMIPPGLAFATLNEKAWDMVSKSKLPKFYFDLLKYRSKHPDGQTPYTPAVSLITGLKAALDMITSEGIENVWKRHKNMAEAARAGIKALGLELFSSSPSDVVTSVKVPEGIDGLKLVKLLREKYGVSIAGGQMDMKGKIFRLAHLGYMQRFDLIIGMSAIEMGLKELGYEVKLGAGVAATEEEILKWG